MRGLMRCGVAGLLLAGGLVAVASPAGAAERARCAFGRWKLIEVKHSEKLIDSTETMVNRMRGGAGIVMELRRGKVRYDFSRSRKVHSRITTTAPWGRPLTSWLRYRGRVRIDATVRGDRRGTLRTDASTARGTARFRMVYTGYAATVWGGSGDLGVDRMTGPYGWSTGTASDVVVPLRARYTCTPTRLVLTHREVGEDPGLFKRIDTYTWRYRRL
jgi:hypothetical protein